MKIQTKITLLFFFIATVGLVVLNASIFYFISSFNFEDFFKRLETRVNLTAEVKIHPDEQSKAYEAVRLRYLEKLENESEYVVKIGTGNRFVKPVKLDDSFYREILTRGKARYTQHNIFYAGGFFEVNGEKYIVIVSAEDAYGFKELKQLKRFLLIIFFISLLMIYLTARIFSYYMVKPVRSIIKSVKNISANNLHSRLVELDSRDELAELVLTFNNMLTKLETAFETQNNFVSNASHELRTPLTIITSESELLIKNGGLNSAASNSVRTILEEAEKLVNILSSLLGLAQTGFNGKKQNWEPVRVDELILNVADAVKKIEPESILDLDFSSLPVNEKLLYVNGNFNLLKLAISNIVLNACKYSNNNAVTVKVRIEEGRIQIGVIDKGIGIPENEQQKIFEPFFRASNTTDFQGYGIGLPLTLNIVRLHNGAISIRSEEQIGTEIRVILPINSN